MLRGLEPQELCSVFRDNEIMAMPKGQSDVRPVGIGCTLRKLSSIAAFQRLMEFNYSHFDSLQFGLRSNGLETIVHSINWHRILIGICIR